MLRLSSKTEPFRSFKNSGFPLKPFLKVDLIRNLLKSVLFSCIKSSSTQTFGHWELDTVVSGRGKSKGCVATFIERKIRLYTANPFQRNCRT
ncbi:hypothetical protein D3C76_296150 [compost metagenome]